MLYEAYLPAWLVSYAMKSHCLWKKQIFTIFLNKITSHSISLMNYCALKVMIKYVTLKKLISGEFLLKLSLLKSFINI